MRRPSKWTTAATLLAAVLTAVACTPQPGTPAPTGSITPDPVPLPAPVGTATFRVKQDAANVTWTGLLPNEVVFIDVCRRDDSDPAFANPAVSCSGLSEYVLPAATQTGSGAKRIALFRGENPDGDSGWGCFAADDVAPAGIEKVTTCYVRIVSGNPFTPKRSLSIPFTIVDGPDVPDPIIPDLPAGPALTVGASAIVVGALARRRRRSAPSES